MHIRNPILDFPFALISGQGLGVSHSSLYSLGSFLPSRPLGQAKIKCFAGLATGNLCVQDHVLHFPDRGGEVDFSFIYNAQTSAPSWRLAFGRKIDTTKEGKSMTVVEKDGHQVDYLYHAEDDCYYATTYQKAMPFIRYDKETGLWTRYDTHSRTKEHFNAAGQLIKHIDKVGHETVYEYNDAQQLQAIIAASGVR